MIYFKLSAFSDSTISTIVCNDADWGQNAVFTLSITSGNANSLFSLNGTTLIADGHRLDYEAMDDRVFVLSVIAVDRPESGRPRTGSSVIIIKVPEIRFGYFKCNVSHINDNPFL